MTERRIKVSECMESVIDDAPDSLQYFERTPRSWSGSDEPRTLEGGDTAYWSETKPREYTGMFGSVQRVDPEDVERWQPILMIRGTGRGDYNGASTVDRANMNWLLEHFPDTFIVVGQSSHDGQQLALPMDAEISEELAELLPGLWEYSEPLDSDAYHALEAQILDEDWDSWLKSDVWSEVETALVAKHSLDIYAVDMEEHINSLLAGLGHEDVYAGFKEIFYAALEACEIWPEFETSESCYIRDLATVAKRMADILDGEGE